MQRVEELTSQLSECLLTATGLSCALVQDMTSTYVSMAQQHVGTLSRLTDNDQDPAPTVKQDIERFLWEYLADRTHTRTPEAEAVACNYSSLQCGDGEVRARSVCTPVSLVIHNGHALPSCGPTLLLAVCLRAQTVSPNRQRCPSEGREYTAHVFASNPLPELRQMRCQCQTLPWQRPLPHTGASAVS